MPIYEYVCSECNNFFSKLISSPSATVECPKCGSKKVSRQFSTFAAHGGGDSCKCPTAKSCPMSGGGVCGGCPGSM